MIISAINFSKGLFPSDDGLRTPCQHQTDVGDGSELWTVITPSLRGK